jgi:hypothetical protein
MLCNFEIFSLNKVLSLSTGSYKKNKWETLTKPFNENESLDDEKSSLESISDVKEESFGNSFFSNISQLKQPIIGLISNENKNIDSDEEKVDEEEKSVVIKEVVSAGVKGTFQIIAILCSNKDILLRFHGNIDIEEENDEEEEEKEKTKEKIKDMEINGSILKCITYFKDNKKKISSISIEESAKYLSVVTESRLIYIIPICTIIFPFLKVNKWPFKIINKNNEETSGSKLTNEIPLLSKINEKNQTDFLEDLTIIKQCSTTKIIEKTKSKRLTCSIWWRTFDDRDFLIIGTEKGIIIIYNIKLQKVEYLIPGILSSIKKIELLKDPLEMYSYILVYTKGSFYNIILEQFDTKFHTYKNIIDFKPESFLFVDKKEDSELFTPQKIEKLNKDCPCKFTIISNSKKGIR